MVVANVPELNAEQSARRSIVDDTADRALNGDPVPVCVVELLQECVAAMLSLQDVSDQVEARYGAIPRNDS